MLEGFDEGKTCIDCHAGIAHSLPAMYEIDPIAVMETQLGNRDHIVLIRNQTGYGVATLTLADSNLISLEALFCYNSLRFCNSGKSAYR